MSALTFDILQEAVRQQLPCFVSNMKDRSGLELAALLGGRIGALTERCSVGDALEKGRIKLSEEEIHDLNLNVTRAIADIVILCQIMSLRFNADLQGMILQRMEEVAIEQGIRPALSEALASKSSRQDENEPYKIGDVVRIGLSDKLFTVIEVAEDQSGANNHKYRLKTLNGSVTLKGFHKQIFPVRLTAIDNPKPEPDQMIQARKQWSEAENDDGA